jgi:hypothetical protein
MAFTQIQPDQTAAKATIDEELMDVGLRQNFDDHEVRILQLEALSGGADEVDVTDLFARLETDPRFLNDLGILYTRRFHLQSNFNNSIKDLDGLPEAPDWSNNDREFLRIVEPVRQTGTINYVANDTDYFKGGTASLEKDTKIELYIKRGWNFFSIGAGILNTTACDSLTILIDGQTPSSLGLTDINGDAATDTISFNSTDAQYQRNFFFFGLDGDRHLVTIQNTDSASKEAQINYIDVGYCSRDFTIDHTLRFNPFKASINGVSVDFSAQDLEIDKSTAYGHTAMVVGDAAGNLRVVKGLEGAKTQLKAGESIAFSSAVTSLPCINTSYFPTKGVCLFQHPNGEIYPFSYNGKTETNIQSHSLDNIVWQKQPSEDIDIESGFEDIDSLGQATGNALITYWGDPTVLIDTGNNKLDFEITITDNLGVDQTTSHTATIPSGYYAGDLVQLSEAIERAMVAAKSLSAENGRYLVQWDTATQRYRIGVEGKNIVGIELLFATGANFASSIHPELGFNDTDLALSKVHYGNTAADHKFRKAYVPDKDLWTVRHPNIKWNNAASFSDQNAYYDVFRRRGIGDTETFAGNGVTGNNMPMMQICVDPDACGLSISLSSHTVSNSPMLEFSIDDGEQIYIGNPSAHLVGTTIAEFANITTYFIPFPRGSKKINVISNRLAAFIQTTNGGGIIDAVGIRQYFSRPLIEDIDTDTEQIIQCYDVAPATPRYKTTYLHQNGTLYVPDSNSNLSTITEVGASWTGIAAGPYYGGGARDAQTLNDYVDIDFVVNNTSGFGGIGIHHYRSTDGATVNAYISTSPINESTDLIKTYTISASTGSASDRYECFKLDGIPNGTYTLRLKQVSTNTGNDRMYFVGISLYENDIIQKNKYVVSEMAVDGDVISHPNNVRRETFTQSSGDRVPELLKLHDYKFGEPNYLRYSADCGFENFQFNSSIYTESAYFNMKTSFTQNDFYEAFQLCKSVVQRSFLFGSYGQNNVCFVDGRQTSSTFSHRQTGKNGATNNTYKNESPTFTKSFEFDVTMSGKVISMSDTRGVRVGQRVIIVDNLGNEEINYIESVTADVSVTVRNPLDAIVDTDVIQLKFYGLHSIRVRNDDSITSWYGTIDFEPLDLQPSRFKRLTASGTKLEQVVINFLGGNGSICPLPVFSDGSIPSNNNMDYYTINNGQNTALTLFPYMVVAAGTTWVRVSAKKLVPENTRIFNWEF